MSRRWILASVCLGIALSGLSVVNGCKSEEEYNEEEEAKMKNIASKLSKDMDTVQLLDALLLLSQNDTVKLCEALIMPKETFTRLARKESTPTAIGLERLKDLFILTNTYGNPFLESCAEYGRERKAEFANDENRLRLISVWEEQADTGIKKGSGILS